MVRVNLLKHPENSHRKKVVFPKYCTSLAEFFGIMMGDGGINNDWQANITLNSEKDAEYAKYISNLCYLLFKITPAIRKRKTRKTLVVSLTSTSIVDFLIENGLARGNKLKNGLKIPNWILEKPKFSKACVRGLVDTDGCMYIHTHKVLGKIYKSMGLCFTSFSPELVFQFNNILAKFGVRHPRQRRWLDE